MLNMLTTLLMLTACGGSEPEEQELTPPPEPAAEEAVAEDTKTDEAATDGADAAEDADPNAITAENWKTHPDIKAIRGAVTRIRKKSKSPSWTAMNHAFEDHCGEHGIHKVSIAHLEEGAPVVQFKLVEGEGEATRETTTFYGEDGQAIFVSSTFSTGSAESTQVARAFYAEGKVLFAPPVEQTSDKAGPADDKALEDLVVLTADAAQSRFFEVAKMCNE